MPDAGSTDPGVDAGPGGPGQPTPLGGRYWNFDADTGEVIWTGNGSDIMTVARYASGPCAGQAAGTCRLDSRTIWLDGAGHKIESITAYGRYWNFDLDDGNAADPANGSSLESVSRYASGPCAFGGAGPCTFDSRTIVVLGDEEIESITAYGRYWNFDIDSGQPLPTSGSDLTSVSRYAAGPCAGRSAGTCQFQSRSFYVGGDGHRIESITAYGRYWNFDADDGYAPSPDNGRDLTSVARYAAGPCQGRAPGTCVFDSRAIAFFGDTQVESIIALR